MSYPVQLLSPFQCGPIQLKNRLTAAPVVTGWEYEDDLTRLKKHFVEYARDGVSMVTVSSGVVLNKAKPVKRAQVFDQTQALRHKPMLEALHQNGCKVALQLIHAGHRAKAWFRSAVTVVTDIGLKKIIQAYAKTAELAVRTGYDAVEILASGQSLPAAFLSPTLNTRSDGWGGNQLGRFKLCLDIVRAVRKSIGNNKAIGFRFNLMELTPSGVDWDEILRFLQMLRIAGVDYLCADFGGIDERIPTHAWNLPSGVWRQDYEALAEATDLVVFFGHRFGSLTQAETLAQAHANAAFELTDELLADNRFIHKSLGLINETIIPWIDLDEKYIYNDIFRDSPVLNIANPVHYILQGDEIAQTTTPKTIVVVGAGPVGIHFSYVAAMRGHHVTLLEKNDKIGGSLRFMEKIYQSEAISNWLKILENRLDISKVSVKLNTKATIQDILSLGHADLVVVTTGAESVIPDIPGIDSSNVLTFSEIFEEGAPVGNRVAVLGTDSMALPLCCYLLNSAQSAYSDPVAWRQAWGIGDIRIHKGGVLGFIPEITPSDRLVYLFELQSGQIENIRHSQMCRWLLMHGLHTLSQNNVDAIDNYSVRVSYGERHIDRFTVRVDHVLVSCGCVPQNELAEELERFNCPHMCFGSALKASSFDLVTSILQAVRKALIV